MFIELFGLPGAGKSTLARALHKLDNSFTHSEQPSKIRGMLYSLHHPLIVGYWSGQILVETYRTRTWNLVRFKFALLLSTFSHLYTGHTGSIKVTEEGMHQRLLSIFETKKNMADMRFALQYMTQPDVLVHVVGNNEYHFVRYQSKSNQRAQLGEVYLANWEAAVRHNYQVMLAVLKEQGIAYHTYDSASATVSEVHHYINQYD